MRKRIELLPLVSAIGLPVFVVGMGLLAGYITGGGADSGFWANLLAICIALVALGAAAVVLHERAWTYLHHVIVTVVTGIALLAGFFAAALGINQWVLVGSGETATCTVTSLSDRTVSYGETTATLYDHGLECAGGTPDHTTTVGKPLAEPGEHIDVIYDPDEYIETRPLQDVQHWRIYLWITLGGLGLALVIGLGEVLAYWLRRY